VVDPAVVDVGLVFEAGALVDVGVVSVEKHFDFEGFPSVNYQVQTCSLSLA
jgi:hypothetical protein